MKTTQTPQWIKRLAVTLAASGFCISAHSADFEPSIAPAVHVSWPTTTNRAYQVQVSTNIPGNWTPTGQLIEGTGGRVGVFFTATNGQRFVRLQETTASGLAWLHGTWQGLACQTGPGIPLYDFTARFSIDSTNRVFTAAYIFTFDTCAANLSLLSYSDTQAQFRSSIQSGNCIEATVLLTRVNPTNVAYHFISTNPPGTGGGLLTKR